MTLEEIKTYCLEKNRAYEDYPFGDIPICCKVNNKIFAQIYPYKDDYKITLKCTAEFGQFYRMAYPGKVVHGYHCPPVQQPYWNTIYLEDFPDEELLNMIDHAYDTVINSFSKRVQRELFKTESKPTILLTAFKGSSAEELLKNADKNNILLLPNDKTKDGELLISAISNGCYDYVICFGQRPNIKNKVHIETTAKDSDLLLNTNWDYEQLDKLLKDNGITSKISHNSGTSFCNSLYFNGLKYISDNRLSTKIIFIHIPYMKNISDFDSFAKTLPDIILNNILDKNY